MKKSVITQIEELVAKVTEESGKADADRRLDALKILQPFYTIMKKAQLKNGDEEEDVDEPTMGSLQRRLERLPHEH